MMNMGKQANQQVFGPAATAWIDFTRESRGFAREVARRHDPKAREIRKSKDQISGAC